FIQPEYTLNLLDLDHEYLAGTIRSKLTRNIAVTFKEVHEELIISLDGSIPMQGDDWVKVPVVETMQRVICATTNRVFVGSSLCQDQDYLTLNFEHRGQCCQIRGNHRVVPKTSQTTMVEERFAKMEEFGDDWDDKPVQNDMLMWLMSEAKGVVESYLYNLSDVYDRYFTISFPTRNTLNPSATTLRTAVAEEGWTKAGMDKMHKIDSFLQESQRVDGPGVLSLIRLALRPFTFSNGVTVPAGTLIAVPTAAIHMDGEIFRNPEEFDGFRFAKLRERDGHAVARHQATSTSTEYLTFGYGRHACHSYSPISPGRFLAVNEVKALLAHILVTYDIKFEEGKTGPTQLYHQCGWTPMPSEKDSPSPPAATINGHVLIIVMGVSGSGKSTLGTALAKALGCPFVDGDDLHPQANINKMSKGEPLTDADRGPWLVNVRRTALKAAESDSQDGMAGVVVACSALKASYREVLRGKRAELDLSVHPAVGGRDRDTSGSDHGDAHLGGEQSVQRVSSPPSTWRTFFVHPFGPREALLERMMARKSHFMKAGMLTSQLDALENPLGTGETEIVPIRLVASVEEQVWAALEGLTAAGVIKPIEEIDTRNMVAHDAPSAV
ncbi:cytochrome P450, partial [Lactarius psammicola]